MEREDGTFLRSGAWGFGFLESLKGPDKKTAEGKKMQQENMQQHAEKK